MADSGRKHLVWDIRKSLLALSGEELYQLTKTVGPVSGKEQSELGRKIRRDVSNTSTRSCTVSSCLIQRTVVWLI